MHIFNDYFSIILEQWKKDKLSIDLRECFELLAINKKRLNLTKAVDKYTGANAIHYCCILGHTELLQKLIETNSSLAVSKDEDGNTPLHYLCLNTVSKFGELKDMWKWLKTFGAKENIKNNDGQTCLDVLDHRIKLSNPYDVLAKNLSILRSL